MISVVVPSYNHAAFISQAIQGVVRQTYEDWEVIVIDDGSTDNSVEVARSFGDPRIRVEVNPSNIGAYATENRGLEMARGEFVAILNSDDAWAAEKLALQMAVFERHPELELCYTLGTIVDGRGDPMPGEDHHLDYPREEVQDVLPHLFRVNRVLASSVVFRRGATRFDPNLRYSGDWTALLAVARRGPVGFVNQPVTMWRHHGANSSAWHDKTIFEEIRVRRLILDHRDLWREHANSPMLTDCAVRLNGLYLLMGDLPKAAEAAQLARSLNPDHATARKRALFSRLPLSFQTRRIWPGWNVDLYRQQYVASPPSPLSLPS